MADRTPQEINAEIISKRKKPQPVQIGEIFGRLTVIAKGKSKKGQGRQFHCQCQCGTTILVLGTRLRNGHTASCGCSRKKYTDIELQKRKLEAKKRYYQRNKHKWREYQRSHPRSTEKKQAYNRKYYALNRTKEINRCIAYTKSRKQNDANFKKSLSLRNRLYAAIRSEQISGTIIDELGCSIAFFKHYIAAKFSPGMTWENWGIVTWHLDHIKPLSSFDLTNRSQYLEACHYTNYQPLWAEENRAKRTRTL